MVTSREREACASLACCKCGTTNVVLLCTASRAVYVRVSCINVLEIRMVFGMVGTCFVILDLRCFIHHF